MMELVFVVGLLSAFLNFGVFRSGQQETPHAIVFVYLRCNCHTGIWEYPIISKDSGGLRL